MKKVLCSFLIIILSFILCCCQSENIREEKEIGPPLSDGTETYYINQYNMNDELIHSKKFNEKDEILEEYSFSYSYDLNGRLIKTKKTDLKTENYVEISFNKLKKKTEEALFNKNGVIIDKKDFFPNGTVKKEYIYKDGTEAEYILFDYYSDNQIKNETVYSVSGKTVKMTTYYKNKLIYQIKDFSEDGMIERITKYSYKGEEIIKKSIYNSEFILEETTDYTKNPPETIEYKDGNPINNKTAENS